jgi:hypothetical protein
LENAVPEKHEKAEKATVFPGMLRIFQEFAALRKLEFLRKQMIVWREGEPSVVDWMRILECGIFDPAANLRL